MGSPLPGPQSAQVGGNWGSVSPSGQKMDGSLSASCCRILLWTDQQTPRGQCRWQLLNKAIFFFTVFVCLLFWTKIFLARNRTWYVEKMDLKWGISQTKQAHDVPLYDGCCFLCISWLISQQYWWAPLQGSSLPFTQYTYSATYHSPPTDHSLCTTYLLTDHSPWTTYWPLTTRNLLTTHREPLTMNHLLTTGVDDVQVLGRAGATRVTKDALGRRHGAAAAGVAALNHLLQGAACVALWIPKQRK